MIDVGQWPIESLPRFGGGTASLALAFKNITAIHHLQDMIDVVNSFALDLLQKGEVNR